MKIRVKIQRDKQWIATFTRQERWWVTESNGSYFSVFKRSDGFWFSLMGISLEFQSMAEAIKDGLTRLHPKPDGENYRKIRAKERVFTINSARTQRNRTHRK